ncbi:MAG: two-component sensor histidine kinase [Methanobacteriales archaeon HGW-Methanobacteriales-2]|nr:MAG: two-component sensor histidine kinase [Methanobacteriales archaeon HGW-Methanobacteriales-2]
MEDNRPDPEVLLTALKRFEERHNKGKLKIFFGMSAGVGKTYAMLKSAHKLKDEGVDVVIGYVETHGRIETDELVADLELIPRIKISYNGLEIEDLNLDAVIKRKPAVVLVDEMAHTNAEGMRHMKRYNDIVELMDNGINVYTTLNVQHVKSQSDVVEQITGVKIRETVPDSKIDLADSIELIDISPDGLLKRLSEGKVYIPEKAELAASRFFRKGNITALREMALNYVAKSVDNDMRDYMMTRKIPGPWKAGDRLMVAVSPSPYSEYLIRWTRRMAFNLKASWFALYIEKQKTLSEQDERNLTRNLNIARELGAEVISTIDEDIVSGLMRVAAQRNITQIIVGKPLKPYLSDYFSGGNLVERLLKVSGDIEIHIVSQPKVQPKSKLFFHSLSIPSKLNEYFISISSVSIITLFNFLLVQYTGYWTIALVYLFYISIAALFIGRGAVFLSALLSSVAWNFLFIPPLHTFRIGKIEDLAMFITYFIIAFIIGGLTSKLREKEWAIAQREKRISELYEFSKLISNATDINESIQLSVKYFEDNFISKSAFILADDSGNLNPHVHEKSNLDIGSNGSGVAEWVFRNNKSAGIGTETLPQAGALFIPLNAGGYMTGVLAIRRDDNNEFTFEQNNFLMNISYHLSMRFQKEMISEKSTKTKLIEESERLYRILLNSLSHELRTPLTTITGASSSLMDEIVLSQPETRNSLIREINRAGLKLNRLVDNLLDMSRLESGMLKLNLNKHDVSDLVSVVIRELEPDLQNYKVVIDIADEIPMINIDFVLMEQVLINLVYNALNYTGAGTEIKIESHMQKDHLIISVSDNGPGITPEDIPGLFDKFKRGVTSKPGGTGLGLSICRGIIESHKGTITARNRPAGGAEFLISLPSENKKTEEDMVNNE